MKCETCGEELPALARRNRRYCDARCRRRAFEQRRRSAELELAPVVPIVEQIDVRAPDEARLVSLIAAEAEHMARGGLAARARLSVELGAGPPTLPPRTRGGRARPGDPFDEIDMLASKRRRKGASQPLRSRQFASRRRPTGPVSFPGAE